MDPIDADKIFEQDLDYLVDLNVDIIVLQHNFSEMMEKELAKRFMDIIAASAISTDYYWEYATGENPTLPVDKKIEKKVCRYVSRHIPRNVYSDIMEGSRTIAECSKLFLLSTNIPSQIGLGSYQNCRRNTSSSIYYGNAAVEYIEVNNNWTPEYYITFQEDRAGIVNETARLVKKLHSLGEPPGEIQVKAINALVSRNEYQIFRQPSIVVALKITWKERTDAVNEYLARIMNSFRHAIETSYSLLISEKCPLYEFARKSG
jgi:hypothetical protein